MPETLRLYALTKLFHLFSKSCSVSKIMPIRRNFFKTTVHIEFGLRIHFFTSFSASDLKCISLRVSSGCHFTPALVSKTLSSLASESSSISSLKLIYIIICFSNDYLNFHTHLLSIL